MLEKLTRVYIAGPLRNPDPKIQAQNIKEAERVAILYWNAGYNVYCPHLNSGGLIGLINEKLALKACLEELEISDIIVFLTNWESSEGSVDEYWCAIELDKMVIMNEVDPILPIKEWMEYIDNVK